MRECLQNNEKDSKTMNFRKSANNKRAGRRDNMSQEKYAKKASFAQQKLKCNRNLADETRATIFLRDFKAKQVSIDQFLGYCIYTS